MIEAPESDTARSLHSQLTYFHLPLGLLITLSRTEGYCNNDEWNTRYDACMICASTFEICTYYTITPLTEECDLAPTLSPSSWVASSAVAEVESSTSAVLISTTDVPPPRPPVPVPTRPPTVPGADSTETSCALVATTFSTAAQRSQSPSIIISNGAAKTFGFGAAAVAMAAVYWISYDGHGHDLWT
ncbi:hypothetical protein QQZ08_008487 [Neonectria magnoliae]|uniref:Uncharacterized protein n=1 Tax=Neonectria magnoliae TaxID=2732573 RepID=A0ABR1HUI8_9HYPO